MGKTAETNTIIPPNKATPRDRDKPRTTYTRQPKISPPPPHPPINVWED